MAPTSRQAIKSLRRASPPLSSASEEVVRFSRWDNLGISYDVCVHLMHRTIPSFSFKGSISRPRSTSSSSSARATTPCLSSAALQDGSYQPGRAYQELELRGVSKVFGARDKKRLGKSSCRSFTLLMIQSDDFSLAQNALVGQTYVD